MQCQLSDSLPWRGQVAPPCPGCLPVNVTPSHLLSLLAVCTLIVWHGQGVGVDFKRWQAVFACHMLVSSSDLPCRLSSPALSKGLLLQASSWRLHLQ